MYKNGATVGSTSADGLSTSNYRGYTVRFYDVAIGDTLELAIWCSSNTNITVQGSFFHVIPTRLFPTLKPCIEVGYTFGNYTYPSQATPYVTIQSREYIGDSIVNSIPGNTTTSRTFTGLSFASQNDYGLFRYGVGDYDNPNSARILDDGTSSYIYKSAYPTTITFRELLI
jgi:hypothetical protein